VAGGFAVKESPQFVQHELVARTPAAIVAASAKTATTAASIFARFRFIDV
jgi:hypothetical protein